MFAVHTEPQATDCCFQLLTSSPDYSRTCRFVSTISTMMSRSTSNSIRPRLTSRSSQYLPFPLRYLAQEITHLSSRGLSRHLSVSFDSSSPSHSTCSSSSSHRAHLCIVSQSTSLLPTATATVWVPPTWSVSTANAKLWLDRATTQALPTHLGAVGPAVQSAWDSAPPNLLLHSTKSYC